MKRGKESDEQIASMGPMFPRLHVSDAADKGGPRAPPRNKMALYEQLSIPSQRVNHWSLPPGHNSATNLVPPASSSQGSGCGKPSVYPLRPLSASTRVSEKFSVHNPDAANTGTSTSQLKSRKRARAEEDFTVPVYVRLKTGLGRDPNSANGSMSDHSVKTHSASNRNFRHDLQNPSAQDQRAMNSSRLQDEALMDTGKGIGSTSRNNSHVGEHLRSHTEDDDNCDFPRERMQWPPLGGVSGGGDDISEEMIYPEIGLHISPDDVVGVIGQKQFWRARRALVNQQRVFAVQVFELHRLIKVQRLIAESPNLLLEDMSLKIVPQNKLTIKIIKPPVQNPEHREETDEQAHEIEQSAENGVSKTSFSSVIRSCQPQAGPMHSIHAAPDYNETGFWAYHQQPAPKHQWLIPVMTPSEGLVYKPYPGPGYMEPYNGQGPAPFMNSFAGPTYGMPAHFPSYGAPMMGPCFSGSSVEQIHQSRRAENPDRNIPHQSSCNDPRQDPVPSAPAKKFQVSQNQLSTASSTSERPTGEAGGMLPLFPIATQVTSDASEPHEQPTRAIKVIPHNRRSATESAARIFQSIQEERKLYE